MMEEGVNCWVDEDDVDDEGGECDRHIFEGSDYLCQGGLLRLKEKCSVCWISGLRNNTDAARRRGYITLSIVSLDLHHNPALQILPGTPGPVSLL